MATHDTSIAEERSARLPAAARLQRAAVLMRRAASLSGEVARLLTLAQEEIREGLGELPAEQQWAHCIHTGTELRRREAQATATRLPVFAHAVALLVMPRDSGPEGGATQGAVEGGAL